MSLAVSVVIPTYRRPALLDRCLRALTRQDRDEGLAYEIVVADDAASADTERQVAEWARAAAPLLVRYVAVGPPHGPAAARNAGWRAARGALIAFTDDDTIPDPRWLAEGWAAVTGEAVAAWGRTVVPLPPSPTDYERNEGGLATARFITANCFVRRSALKALDGFDERFRMAWREDSDLHFRLLGLAGERGVAHAPRALVVHPVRPAGWGVSLRLQRKAQYNALLYKKHPKLYRALIQARPPLPYYGTVAAIALGLGAAAAGSRPVAAAAGAAWAWLTARFMARRLRHTSRAPRHVAEMLVTSALIPPLAVYWRLRGAWRFRVLFL